MNIEALIADYGLWALAVGAVVEGETVLMIGGAMVHRGLLEFGPAWAEAAAGSFAGDQAYFLLARRFRDHPRVQAMIARPAFARAQAVFERHPSLFVFGFRFIYGMRTVSPLAIGVTRYPALRFMAINAVAAVIWAGAFIAAGYAFGRGLHAVFGRLRTAEHLALTVVGVGLIGAGLWLLGRHLRRRWQRSPPPQ